MDFSDFYFLKNGYSDGDLNVTPNDRVSREDAKAIWRGEKKIIEPIGFHRNIGGKLKDHISCDFCGFYFYSERFFELLEKESFTGWESYPVKITGKKKEPVEGYRGLSIHGNCGKPDYLRREKIETVFQSTGEISTSWRGFYFDLNSWDGSDFFCPEGTYYIIVPKRVKDIIEKAKFIIEFEQITELETLFNYNADGKMIFH